MKRRSFIQIAAGASLGAGISPLIAATGNSMIPPPDTSLIPLLHTSETERPRQKQHY